MSISKKIHDLLAAAGTPGEFTDDEALLLIMLADQRIFAEVEKSLRVAVASGELAEQEVTNFFARVDIARQEVLGATQNYDQALADAEETRLEEKCRDLEKQLRALATLDAELTQLIKNA